MRFNQVLHPEILTGTRGNQSQRSFFKDLMIAFKIKNGMPYYSRELYLKCFEIHKRPLPDVSRSVSAYGLLKMYLNSERKIYHFGSEFFSALLAADKEMPVELLPQAFCAYLSFPRNLVSDLSKESVEGAYVRICEDETNEGLHTLFYTSVGQDSWSFVSIPLIKGKIVDHLYNSIPIKHDFELSNEPNLFRAIINAIVYIHSQQPNLENKTPFRDLPYNARSTARSEDLVNECALPITFVNWRWKRPLPQHGVSGHWKWQACGESLKNRKFIYVEDYERGVVLEGGNANF